MQADIHHRSTPLCFVNVVLRDLDLHFQCQTFSCYAFVIKSVLTANVHVRFASTRTAPVVELLLKHFCYHLYSKTCLYVLNNYICFVLLIVIYTVFVSVI